MSKKSSGTIITPRCPNCGEGLDSLRAEIATVYRITSIVGGFKPCLGKGIIQIDYGTQMSDDMIVHCSCGHSAPWKKFLQKEPYKSEKEPPTSKCEDDEVFDIGQGEGLGSECDNDEVDDLGGPENYPRFCHELKHDSDGKPCDFHNYYRCPKCRIAWDDWWSCACNDKCPNCNAEIEPEDTIDALMEKEGWKRMEDHVLSATTEQLEVIWESLKRDGWGKNTPSSFVGVMMDDWAQRVKVELEYRETQIEKIKKEEKGEVAVHPTIKEIIAEKTKGRIDVLVNFSREELILVRTSMINVLSPNGGMLYKKSPLYQKLDKALDQAIAERKKLEEKFQSLKEIKAEITPASVFCKETCPNQGECAQHETAGDFRSEDGMTPTLILKDGKAYCTKKDTKERWGALRIKNGSLTVI